MTAPMRIPGRAIALFVALVLALGWLVALPLWLGGEGAAPLAGILLPALMWTPAAATAIVILAMKAPRRDVLRFLGVWPLRPIRRTIGFAVGALLGPIVVTVLVIAVAVWLGLVRLDLVGFSGFAAQLAASGVDPETLPLGTLVLVQLLTVPIAAIVPNAILALGEEIGWRGWLLPALRPWGTWPALLVTGAVWGLWHAPIVLLGHNFGRTDLTGVLLMIAGCVAWGVLLGWTRLRTGSVWPAVLAHGSLNAVGGMVLVLAAAGEPVDLAVVGPLGVVAWGVIAAIVGVIALAGGFRDARTSARLETQPGA